MAVSDNAIIRAAAHFDGLSASDIVNIYHFVMDSVGDQSEEDVLDDLLDYVQAAMATVEGFYGSGLGLTNLLAWVRNEATDQWDYIGAVDGTWSGTQGSAEQLPAQNAPQVNMDTTNAHSHGRKYLPPPLETAVGSGILVGGMQTAMLNYFDEITSVYVGTAAEYSVGVWSEKLSNFLQFSGTGSVPVDIGTQRRRKRGVGD